MLNSYQFLSVRLLAKIRFLTIQIKTSWLFRSVDSHKSHVLQFWETHANHPGEVVSNGVLVSTASNIPMGFGDVRANGMPQERAPWEVQSCSVMEQTGAVENRVPEQRRNVIEMLAPFKPNCRTFMATSAAVRHNDMMSHTTITLDDASSPTVSCQMAD